MKGFALLALLVALQSAFLLSVQLTPSRDEAAAQLWHDRQQAAAAARAAPQQDEEPRLVDVKDPIVVVVRG